MNYAGFWRRFAAYVIDAIILSIPSLVAGGALSMSGALGAGVILGLIYYPVFESSSLSATPGKALLGLAVVTEAGDRITFKSAALRYFCRYLSAAILYIGYFMQAFTGKRQTLHDMISETIVINRASDADVNYFTVWKDQFKEVINKL